MTASRPHAATQSATRDTSSDTPRSVRCPRCGNRFDCGRHAEPFDCWCKSLPALPASQLDPRGRCLCPECLAAAVASERTPSGSSPGR
ncbi:cysteine-rich CWC family protein [Paraburkholderia sp. Ac-20347]|uniref:cysteine-rich CWC family protein n=1 Tax=Paraburkholderia sp. Ac-20347 TaxID=2703892 RepID=UPI001980EDCB|nr:cysteine-rich CWC family protein [Paraburkholderia sp. Ac-20347]MBN3811217.1 cysteine-rich CWC family protein [Paraburkholderia sp. Ac-20347]